MRKGFSLIELSIGLVIIGLLTGGILAGQSLLRNAEVRSVISDFEKYKNAFIAFRQKYDALPGDFGNAEATWGTAPSGCPGTHLTPATDARTCNGDDSGAIDTSVGYEMMRAWQHLANAGLIEGTYTGVSGGVANSYTAILGTNVPRGRISNSGWHILYRLDSWAGSAGYELAGPHGHVLFFGAAVANSLAGHDILTPSEAWNIDTKVDDGKAGYGKVIAVSYTGCTGATTVTDYAADYTLSASGQTCALQFRQLFQK